MRTLPLPALLLAAALVLASAAAQAGIDVKVEGVDGAVEGNVRAFLSLQRYAGMSDLEASTVERLGQRAEREVRAALVPFGYYEPTVTTEVKPAGSGWTAVVRIEPGPVVTLVAATVTISGPGRDEPFLRAVLAASPLQPGKPLRHADYDAIKGDLQRVAAAHGYLDASFAQADLAVDVGRHEARAGIELATGERYRFGATEILQDVVDAKLVRRFLRWKEGDWYDASMLLRTQFALDDSEYFKLVEVLPGERDRESRTVPIRIRADARERNRYSIAAGYATDTRFRGTLGWRSRRINHRGHRVGAELEASEVNQSVTLSWSIPWTDPAFEKLSFDATVSNEKFGDLDTSGTTLGAALTQVRGGWQRVLSVEATASTSDTGTYNPDGSAIRSSNRLLVPGISYASMPRTVAGTMAVGRAFYAELIGSASAIGSNSDFLRLRFHGERRFGLAPAWYLLLRGDLGLSAVADFEELPPDYRFFAGGDRSVRGYKLDELSPVNAEGEQVGGRHLIVASVEVERDLPRHLAVAVFVDAGNAINHLGDPLAYSAGVGVRLKLPFLSIGLDVAKSISEPGRGPRLHLNVAPVF